MDETDELAGQAICIVAVSTGLEEFGVFCGEGLVLLLQEIKVDPEAIHGHRGGYPEIGIIREGKAEYLKDNLDRNKSRRLKLDTVIGEI